jgi:hypothetical protein
MLKFNCIMLTVTAISVLSFLRWIVKIMLTVADKLTVDNIFVVTDT